MRDSFDTFRSLKYRNARQRNNAKKMEKQQPQERTGAGASSSPTSDEGATPAAVENEATTTAIEDVASEDELGDGVCGGGLGALQSPTGFFLQPPLTDNGDREVHEEAEVWGKDISFSAARPSICVRWYFLTSSFVCAFCFCE